MSSKLPVVIAILAATTAVAKTHNCCRRQNPLVGIHTSWTLPPQSLAPSWGGGREFSRGLPLRPDLVTDPLRPGPVPGVLYQPPVHDKLKRRHPVVLELRGERKPLPQRW